MSWDVHIQDLPRDAATVGDIPDDFRPGPIGVRADLIATIQQACPDARFPTPDEGHVRGDGYSIVISVGDDDPVRSIALFVRGGRAAADVVASIVAGIGLRALDTGTGEFFDLDNPAAGLDAWSGYRQQVTGD